MGESVVAGIKIKKAGLDPGPFDFGPLREHSPSRLVPFQSRALCGIVAGINSLVIVDC
jgi:hypothetical protein